MKAVKAVSIDINGMERPYGIDDRHPVIHYVAADESKITDIIAYRVCVGSRGIVWDTGKRKYPGSNYVLYEGPELEPRTAYTVAVSLWEAGNTGEITGTADFETGFLGTDWKAEWIEPEQKDAVKEKELSFAEMITPHPEFTGGEKRLRVCQELKREFSCSGAVAKARIYASAHGVYNIFLNGRKVAGNRLAPEVSAYGSILYYQTYDITELIREGGNTVGAVLADGWWIGRLGMAGDSCNYGNRLGFIMQLEIEYADGHAETICSDENFVSAPSFITYADLFIGEKHDEHGAAEDQRIWHYCKKAGYAKSNLKGQPHDPVRVTQTLEAAGIEEMSDGSLTVDFGQVLAGVVRAGVRSGAGTQVTFEHSEILDRQGSIINNIRGRNKDQKDVLICSGHSDIFEPQFTYHGFRYVRIRGINRNELESIQALVIGSPIKRTGRFECSDGRLNRLQHCIEWSTAGNMVSIPTDCPQREKLGWTGDILAYADTGCFNYDLRNFLETWLENMRAEQAADGEIPVAVPNFPSQDRCQRKMSGGTNSSAAWSDACVLVPWKLYQSEGNIKVLAENFMMMEKWLAYVKRACEIRPEGYRDFSEEQKLRSRYLWRSQYHFGDWLIPSLRAMPDGIRKGTEETADIVGSCYYAITAECFARVCEVLGKSELAEQYRELLKNIRKAIREEYICDDGSIRGSSLQGLYVLILKAGAAEGELKKKIADRLVKLIHENGDCLDTGFASVPYLLDVLDENGRKDLAYRLLFQDKAPSWLYMVKNGATTIWENWLGILEDGTPTETSYNHYAFGCVGSWIYRHIGGIRIGQPGYRQIIFEPDTGCGIARCSCSHVTPYGQVCLEWEKTEKACTIKGTVPSGTSAVLIAGGQKIKLKSGDFERKFE